MDYQISSLSSDEFSHLFSLDDQALSGLNVVRMTVTDKPGFPCRVTLEDAEVGESVLLLNYEHQSAASPYRSSHAIFVRENATEGITYENEIPEQLRLRSLSIRSFDAAGMMVNAEVCEGSELEAVIERMLGDSSAAYLHLHTAARGCYLARIARFS
ncbi:MAG: DUF1203 domain-containing protein [Woeseiaceae bacterium]